jgi:hypothetical protein
MTVLSDQPVILQTQKNELNDSTIPTRYAKLQISLLFSLPFPFPIPVLPINAIPGTLQSSYSKSIVSS